MTFNLNIFLSPSLVFKQGLSCKKTKLPLNLPVSHTTDDLIFQWDPEVPLVVDEHIELPQLELVQNRTADCTQVYSTGKLFLVIGFKQDQCHNKKNKILISN